MMSHVNFLRYRLAQWLSNRLPPSLAFASAERLADLQWRRSAKDRAAVCANLSLLHGRPLSERAPLVREVFRNFGRYLVEFFTMHRIRRPDVTIVGLHHVQDALRTGRGAILLTAHVGNWELAAALFRRMGFPVAVVALPHEDSRMDRMFNAQRERAGIEVIPLGRVAAQRSLQRLREGCLLGLLGDLEFGGSRVAVSWCGIEVMFPRGPATLSLRSGAPLIPTFLIREGRWRFRLIIEPPVWPARRRGLLASVGALTQAYATVFERSIKRFSDQWLIFQPIVPIVHKKRSSECARPGNSNRRAGGARNSECTSTPARDLPQ